MKTMKKIGALVLAVVMAMALAVPAWAASEPVAAPEDGFTVTINKDASDKAAHTYGAYQLFKGDLSKDGETYTLSNIQWGDNADSAKIITELNKLNGFSLANDATAAQVAKAISDANYTNNSAEAQALAEALNAGITGSPKDTADVAAAGTSGALEGLAPGYYLVKDTTAVTGEGASTKYILEVVKNTEVTEKATVPSVDKEIDESTPTKVSDYNIGDSIPYTITGTLPSDFDKYNTYKTFTFTDTLGNGLTAPTADDISVTVSTKDGTSVKSLFDVVVDGQTITVTLKEGVDLKTATYGTDTKFAASDKIIVSYSAELNENAVIGGDGNINTAKITFSNNPNTQSDGDETGDTPEDKTVVFTYEIDALKVEPTADAQIDATAYAALNDEAKKQYVQVGDKYQKVQPLAGAGFTLYKSDGTTVVKEIAAGETTKFEFSGVDAGTYVLKETTVPTGYNKVPDMTITVTATYTNDKPAKIDTLTVSPDSIKFTADKTSGIVSGMILNEKGSTLPSTGGIGTKIFYTMGAVLVIGAGVVLVSRKRAAE